MRTEMPSWLLILLYLSCFLKLFLHYEFQYSYSYHHRLFRQQYYASIYQSFMKNVDLNLIQFFSIQLHDFRKVLSRLETQNYCNIKYFQLLKSKWMNFVKRNVAKIVFKINRNCISNIMSHDEIGFTFYSLEPSKIWWVIQIRVRTVGLLIDINE